MIEKFMSTGAFHKGTKFWRSERLSSKGAKIHWNYSCPVCSCDEYVENGLCSGVFESTSSSLQKGHMPCRCSSRYKWSREQREYAIHNLLTQRALKYKYCSVDGKWLNSDTTLKFSCPEHGEFSLSLHSFFHGESGCSSCAKTGFDKNKTGYIYVLKADSAINSFTGYGISNVPKNRLKSHHKVLKDRGYIISECKVFKGDGKTIQETERFIINNFEIHSQDIPGFIREATLITNYRRVIDFIRDLNLEETRIDLGRYGGIITIH